MYDAAAGSGGNGGSGGSGGSGGIIGTGGTGGEPTGCSSTCSAPGATTFCVTGHVEKFVSPGVVAFPTVMSGLVVKIFDPIAFVTNPQTPPVTTVNVQDAGCFIADGVPRFSSGLVAIATDDATAGANAYATTALMAVLRPNANLTVQAQYIESSTFESWQAQVGNPPGCVNGLLGCGLWLGEYVDSIGNPIGNVQPTRPGDDPASANIFCFGADRMTLTTADTTSRVGICGISPDAVESHAGRCGSGGCMCGTQACAPSFTAMTAGTAPGVIMLQTFFAQ